MTRPRQRVTGLTDDQGRAREPTSVGRFSPPPPLGLNQNLRERGWADLTWLLSCIFFCIIVHTYATEKRHMIVFSLVRQGCRPRLTEVDTDTYKASKQASKQISVSWYSTQAVLCCYVPEAARCCCFAGPRWESRPPNLTSVLAETGRSCGTLVWGLRWLAGLAHTETGKRWSHHPGTFA